MEFQSTLPVRGATGTPPVPRTKDTCFNPRSPCGERLQRQGDAIESMTFQSTLPVRGATPIRQQYTILSDVSIHAPRAGSDFLPFFLAPFSSSFQSTLPVRGATSRARPADGSRERFNPRSPCGERHRQPARAGLNHVVSIHAPRAGSDRADRVDQIHDPRFNPRSPCGERPGRPAAHAR